MSERTENRADRVRALRDILTRLHAGALPETVERALEAIVREADAAEIAAMERELIEEEKIKDEEMRLRALRAERRSLEYGAAATI